MGTGEESAADLALLEAQEHISAALRGLRFGCIEIQVHDARIVRVTRTEKVRVETPLIQQKNVNKKPR